MLASGARSADKGTESSPPSILLVTIDTLRADHVHCYGDSAATTPNLDRLSLEGVKFEEARSHVPLTLPSHATILTGRLPPRTRVRGNGLFELPPDVPTLAAALRKRGYATVGVVGSVVLDRACGLDRGFDIYDDNQRIGSKQSFGYLERGASQVAESALRELARLKPPFFLWVHFYDPHTPWVPPTEWRERFPKQLYDAEIAFADEAMGVVRKAAEAQSGGRLVVMAMSDHGESLGEHGENQHGYTLHRGVLRVPLLVAGEGIPRGVTVKEEVALVDVAPTIAEIGGTNLEGADGTSLARHWNAASRGLRGPSELPIWEETLHPLYDSGWAPLRGLLDSEWHFIAAPRPELYSRSGGPADQNDVASRDKKVVARLAGQVADMAKSLGDVAEPSTSVSDSPADRERNAKLAALGYLTGAGAKPHAGPRLDPKDGLPGFVALEAASALLQKGNPKEARAKLEPFLKIDPGNPRLWEELGKILAALGDLEGADRAVRKAIALDDRSEFIRFSYASILEKKGDRKGAEAQLRTILAANPRAADAALELASFAIERKDFDGSEKILRASFGAGVRDPDLLDRLGIHALRKGNRDEALKFFEQALSLDGDDPTALLESGRALLRAGRIEDAMKRFGRGALGDRAFECRMELARALIVGPRDLDAARIQLQSARQIAPNDSSRREVDERLAALAKMQTGAPAPN